MKLSVLTVLFQNLNFKEMVEKMVSYGVDSIELGTGGYPGNAHCDPDILLNDKDKLKEFNDTIVSNGLEISALSCHGNPLHPNKEFAINSRETFKKTIELATKLNVDTVVCFSGCPGDCNESKNPNWVTCAWPTDYLEILDWQWNEVAIPYWKKEEKFARENGVKIAFEMHPGFMVYNPETCIKLRENTGPNIGANIDPSHLFWQGIDIIEAIRYLGQNDAIYFFHAKDTNMSKHNTAINGVLDTKNYTDLKNRSWTFRTVGWGHDAKLWKDIISELRIVGYDGAISIEHEDSLTSIEEGLTNAVKLLKECILKEQPADAWWV